MLMSPLVHRIPRQFRNNLGKYLGIFLLIAFTIAFVSGFLIGAGSITKLTNELPEKYKLEDGRVTVSHKLSERQVDAAENGEFSWLDRVLLSFSGDDTNLEDYEQLTLTELFCRDLDCVVPNAPAQTERAITMRLYKQRTEIDLAAVHEGALPTNADEIAIDPTFARNHEISTGDTIEIAGHMLTVSGLITLPDYTTLFEKNSDFIMDDITFCVGILTPEGYAAFDGYSETYTYGFVFDDPNLTLSERTAAEEKLIRALVLGGADVTDLIDVDSNQGVIYAADDAEGDSLMYRIFFYIIVMIMAFIFVVITGANIEEESSVIGTLLASGYGKGELVRHYLILPILLAILAAVVGNLAQYYFIDWTRSAYYNSYSLPPFEIFYDPAVFLQTSVLPVALLFVITLVGLMRKLRYTPLAFLRHEISRAKRGKGIVLPKVWPFFTRFRLRVLLNNLGNIFTIFLGIFISGILLLMGLGILPIVDDMADRMAASLPAEHVYTLTNSEEIPAQDAAVASQAEKLELASLEAPKKWNWGPIKVSVWGIEEESAYWPDLDVSDGKVVIGAGLADKCALAAGDTLTLENPYKEKSYEVTVTGTYGDWTNMNAYMSREVLNELVGNSKDEFNGWVSNEELHFPSRVVNSDLTPDDMTKIADQMRNSMGNIMTLILAAAMVIFIVVIFLLSKTIMERSSRAISQLKVFGYRDGELSRVYVRSLTICVIVALLVTIPLIQVALGGLLDIAFMDYDVTFKLSIPVVVYVEYVALGFACYAVVAILNKLHLKRVSLAVALKSQE